MRCDDEEQRKLFRTVQNYLELFQNYSGAARVLDAFRMKFCRRLIRTSKFSPIRITPKTSLTLRKSAGALAGSNPLSIINRMAFGKMVELQAAMLVCVPEMKTNQIESVPVLDVTGMVV